MLKECVKRIHLRDTNKASMSSCRLSVANCIQQASSSRDLSKSMESQVLWSHDQSIWPRFTQGMIYRNTKDSISWQPKRERAYLPHIYVSHCMGNIATIYTTHKLSTANSINATSENNLYLNGIDSLKCFLGKCEHCICIIDSLSVWSNLQTAQHIYIYWVRMASMFSALANVDLANFIRKIN